MACKGQTLHLFIDVRANKLECLFIVSCLVLYFRLRPILNLGLGWKYLPGTNALAYFVRIVNDQKKFIESTLGPNIIKLFTPVIISVCKKLEYLSLASLSGIM